MKKGLFLLNILILFVFVSCDEKVKEQGDRGYHVKVGDRVENIDFTLIDGSVMSLDDLKGEVVVLQFTASWCSVCRKEMPFLEKEVWQKHRENDFMLIGVDYDEPIDKVLAFTKKMKTTYPMALDLGGKIFLKFSYNKSGVTRNVVIDKDGRIAYLTRLFDREEFDKMKEKIDELLME